MASKATEKKMKKMFNGNLPITKATVIVGLKDGKYIKEEIDVEVLSVHFNTGNMRVRYIANIWGNPNIQTAEVSAENFLKTLTFN